MQICKFIYVYIYEKVVILLLSIFLWNKDGFSTLCWLHCGFYVNFKHDIYWILPTYILTESRMTSIEESWCLKNGIHLLTFFWSPDNLLGDHVGHDNTLVLANSADMVTHFKCPLKEKQKSKVIRTLFAS